MRLIDADKLKKHYTWWGGEEKEMFDTIVDMQPTIEAEPIRHGQWMLKCAALRACGAAAYARTSPPPHQENGNVR